MTSPKKPRDVRWVGCPIKHASSTELGSVPYGQEDLVLLLLIESNDGDEHRSIAAMAIRAVDVLRRASRIALPLLGFLPCCIVALRTFGVIVDGLALRLSLIAL